MRKYTKSDVSSTACAAICQRRIPPIRPIYILAGSIVFFFNLFFIYIYFQYQENEKYISAQGGPSLSSKNGYRATSAVMEVTYSSCKINDTLALNALSRVRTESCRRKITDAACKLKNGVFHEHFPTSRCHNHEPSLANLPVGCFEDQKKNRILDGFSYDFKDDNSAEKCRWFCYRAGFIYYGLEFGRECFCGDSVIGDPIQRTRCMEYLCSGNSSEFCGGFNAISVLHTGFKEKHVMPMAKYMDELDTGNGTKTPRILFLLQLNGRNERQVKRLLKVLYSPIHYYYIHVDRRQLFLLTEMKDVAAILPNIYVTTETHSTIWGGASLLTMIQDAIRRSITMSSFSDWDYLINLSESDFPVLTLHELEVQLQSNPRKSYLSSHGYNTARFIQKQGFDFVFIECENRMWRIGRRAEFPRNLRVDGGSDWLILHREFAEYSISDDELAVKLRALFASVILPVESFFHTLSYNSRFCQNIIGSNLRLTNWNRKQGCRCESLKSVVDWCGCSPLVFTKEHVEKFSLKNAIAKPYYIARKFDSLIDIDAVALAEQQALRDRTHLLHSNDIMFNVSFVNYYKADVDGYSLPFSMMAKSLLSMYSDNILFSALSRIDIVKINSSAPEQVIFTIQTYSSDLPLQLLVERKLVSDIVSPGIADGFKLQDVIAGLDIDHKEEVFRGVTTYADLNSSPTVALRWSRVPGTSTSVNEATKTSPPVRFLWRGPDFRTVAIQNLDPYDSIRGMQFAALNLQKLNVTNIDAGMWSVVVQTDHDESHEVLATVWFPIYSTHDTQLFDSLVHKFITLKDSCSATCSSTTWSTFHPDPKSDIRIGYDKNVRGLL